MKKVLLFTSIFLMLVSLNYAQNAPVKEGINISAGTPEDQQKLGMVR